MSERPPSRPEPRRDEAEPRPPERVEPPRLARALLARALPPPDRDSILGDLEEELVLRGASHGASAARRWYRREVARSLAPALRRRFATERRSSGRPRGRLGAESWWLDTKLGMRMLIRFPGLTLIACVALTLTVGASVGVTSGTREVLTPTLRLPDGDRIVAVQSVNLERAQAEAGSIHDFVEWRDAASSFEVLGAFASATRAVSTGGERGNGVRTGIATASALELSPVRAQLGRGLTAADERPDAPEVVVLGHDLWTSRFGGDPDVVGRSVRVDGRQAEIVGVMPDGYGWPTRFEMWEPFRFDPLDYARGGGPQLRIVGRLAPGISLRDAQAEMEVLGELAAARHPETHASLRPRVVPYLDSFIRASDRYIVLGAYSAFALLVVVVCANVGLLILARTMARTGEIAVRSALGASRRRIIGQLFVETLVLSGLSTALGLILASYGLAFAATRIDVFFWADFGVRAPDLAFAAGLAVLSALVAGVVPGLSATGRRMAGHLQATAGGRARVGFGKGSAVLVGSQIVMSVMVVGATVLFASAAGRLAPDEVDIATEEYALARLWLEGGVPTRDEADRYAEDFAAELAAVHEEIAQRLGAEPGVTAVTLASSAPLKDHAAYFLEVEGRTVEAEDRLPGLVIRRDYVAPNFFDAFDKPVLSGRGFTASDHADGESAIVTEALARQALGGADPVGTRIRIVSRDRSRGPWLTVVGMIPDVWTIPDPLSPKGPAVFLPMAPGRVNPVDVIVRAPGGSASLPQTIRAVSLAVEPSLRVTGVTAMSRLREEQDRGFRMLLWMWALSGGAALILSLASIYAIVSFTVTQRMREIGVRIALGAPGWRLACSVLGRIALPVGIGAVIGAGLLWAVTYFETGGTAYVPHVAVAVVLFALAAGAVPTARGLRAEPAEVLRADG